MGWQIAVRHRTAFAYAAPVVESFNEARMTPASGEGQRTLQDRLEVSPSVRPLRYCDYWGTVVHAFDVHTPHTELEVTSTAVVETSPARAEPPTVSWPELTAASVRDRFAEYLLPSRFAIPEAELDEVAQFLVGRSTPVEAVDAATAWVQDHLTYTKGATGVSTTSAEARALGKGVCQDYAHLTIALGRAMGLPSRYVSGYLCPGKEATIGETTRGESHAWMEFWVGRWLPVDPTSGAPVAQRHIVIARGRDYADVRPFSGVYHGSHTGPVTVSVELTRLR
ncbi:MAG: transglutaminase family protein [Frankiaceae bacterium]|jgi:transglutaminase-like putative cysteine protease